MDRRNKPRSAHARVVDEAWAAQAHPYSLGSFFVAGAGSAPIRCESHRANLLHFHRSRAIMPLRINK